MPLLRHIPVGLAAITILALLGCPTGESGTDDFATVHFDRPEDHEIVAAGDVRFAGGFSGPGIISIQCSAGGETAPALADGDDRFHCTLNLAAEGPHVVRVSARGSSGEVAFDRRSVYVTDQPLDFIAFTPPTFVGTVIQGQTLDHTADVWRPAGVDEVVMTVEDGGQTAIDLSFDSDVGPIWTLDLFFTPGIDAPPGDYPFVFTGTAGTVTGSLEATITVAPSGSPTLEVTNFEPETGTVTSTPAGIACGSDCSEIYPLGTVVTLEALPASSFDGWSLCGDVSNPGDDGNICTVTMDRDRDVVVHWATAETFRLQVSTDGNGSVTSSPPGIACGASQPTPDCEEFYAAETIVTLTASPAGDFQSWSNCPASDGPTCIVTMDQDRAVFAQFTSSPGGRSGP